MKKILLLAILAPCSLWAQESYVPLQVPPSANQPAVSGPLIPSDVIISPVVVVPPSGNAGALVRSGHAQPVQIGATQYDNMTNGASPRRIILYPGGEVSAVWTYSMNAGPGSTPTFPERGTNYAHFDGEDWSGALTTHIESPDRTGWPEIVSIGTGVNAKELIVSHWATTVAQEDGGFFWMMNDAVGSSTFDVTTAFKPYGPLWPRIATSGDYVYLIATYNDDTVIRSGVRNPTVFYRYQISTQQWLDQGITLEGYDSTRYAYGSIDDYSIDARDSVVVIVTGGSVQDIAIWKSTNYGESFTKTIIDSFPMAPFDPWVDPVFDTIQTNDGTVHVILDRNYVSHVFWGNTRVLNEEPETGAPTDSSWTYFPTTNGIMYWNETETDSIKVIAGAPDIDGNGRLEIFSGLSSAQIQEVFKSSSYGGSLSTFPSAAVDQDNNIYLVYSAVVETDVEFSINEHYRDNFVVFSTDGGDTWSNIQNVTPYEQLEDVFPSVARDADDRLHFTWMQDISPGTALLNGDPVSENRIMYNAIPIAEIRAMELGIGGVYISIEEEELSISSVELYPNPATSTANLSLNIHHAGQATVAITDVTGKQTGIAYSSFLPAGTNNLTFDVQSLAAGVYFCQVTVNGQMVTKKLVVN
ncbi:MAG: T9SS type A sorting domain-containing protein [Bacteroidota bacterium]|nr:T9SS type A sorting domain-containing protein [Bacteroidota bacterium]